MPDTTTPATTLAAPAKVTPGYATTEFWVHIAVCAIIAVLTFVVAHATTLGLPPAVTGIVVSVGPLALAWLQKEYADNRTELKTAAIQAAAQIPDAGSAAAKLATP